jgi:hypothetical protein
MNTLISILPVVFQKIDTEENKNTPRLDLTNLKDLGLLHNSVKLIHTHVQGWTGLAVWLDSLVSGTSTSLTSGDHPSGESNTPYHTSSLSMSQSQDHRRLALF